MYSEKPNENKILCTEIVCMCVCFIECIKRIEFCGKDKVFLPAKSLGSFFINRQVLVGLFSTLSFRGRMLFREITDVKLLLLEQNYCCIISLACEVKMHYFT